MNEGVVLSHQKQVRVFVVDDERAIALSLAMILERHGFDATPFTEPLLALQAAQSSSPDLLLSDVMMPGMSGVELAALIKQHCPQCKVLLCSGNSDAENLIETARAAGHNYDFFVKPAHPEYILRRVNLLLQANSENSLDPLTA